MKKLLVVTVSLFLVVIASAQSQFLLYSMKGNVTVVENKVESKAKIGNILGPNATVKIPAGGSVTFVCNEAAMFSFVKAGSYPLSQFNDSCKPGHGSVSSNYIKYVWASMTKSSSNAGSNRRAFMNTVGAVTRDINNVWIHPRLDTVNYSSGNLPLSWMVYADYKTFDFLLYSSDNLAEPFYKAVVSKQKIPITDFAAKLTTGKTYYWTAAITGEENQTLKVFNYVSKENFEKILNGFKSQGAPFEAPAEQAYRVAFLLEDAHFLADAYTYYAKAASLDNNNMLYRSTLLSFKSEYEIK